METKSPKDFDAMEQKYNSIYLHTDSYKCALMAAGSLLNVVDSVMTDQVSCRQLYSQPDTTQLTHVSVTEQKWIRYNQTAGSSC